MAVVDRDTLKSYFNTGDVPTESNYVDLIDSMATGEPGDHTHTAMDIDEGSPVFVSVGTTLNVNVGQDLHVTRDIFGSRDLTLTRDLHVIGVAVFDHSVHGGSGLFDTTLAANSLDVSTSGLFGTTLGANSLNITTSGIFGTSLAAGSLNVTYEATIGQSIYGAHTTFRVIDHTTHSHLVVNPTVSWNLDEQFGVDIDDNLIVRGFIVGKHAIQLKGSTLLCHYDGPEPIEQNYTGAATGHLGQVAYETNIKYRPGHFQKGVCIGEGSHNVCTNGDFETDTSGWTPYLTATISRWSGRVGDYGNSCLRVVTAGGDTGGVYYTYTTSTGGWWSAGASFRGYNSTAIGHEITFLLRITYSDLSNDSFTSAYVIDSFTTYKRGSVSGQANAGKTVTSVILYVRDLQAGTAFAFMLDGVKIENKEYSTPFLSESSSSLFYDNPSTVNLQTKIGTIMFWTKAMSNPGLIASNPYFMFFNVNGTGNSSIYIYISKSSNHVVFGIVNDTGTSYAVNSGYALDCTKDHFFAAVFDSSIMNLYIDGVVVGTPVTGATLPTTWSGSQISIGRQSNSATRWANCVIDELAILNVGIDAALIRAIYESDAPVFAETSTWTWRAAKNLLWTDENGLWMFDQNGVAVIGMCGNDDIGWGGSTLDMGDILFGVYGTSQGGWMLWDRDGASSKGLLSIGWADKTTIKFNSTGAFLYGTLGIDTNGGIYQGTGTFGSPGTGLKLWQSSGIGRITTYEDGYPIIDLLADGSLAVGYNQDILLTKDGQKMRFAAGDSSSIAWYTDLGSLRGYLNCSIIASDEYSFALSMPEVPSVSCHVDLFVDPNTRFLVGPNGFIEEGYGNIHGYVHVGGYMAGTPGIGDIRAMGNIAYYGNLYGVYPNISDDSVYSFTPSKTIGAILLTARAQTYGSINGIVAYRTVATIFTNKVVGWANLDVTTGALTGTTGIDGHVTVSVHTDGKIYIENRWGSTISLNIIPFGT